MKGEVSKGGDARLFLEKKKEEKSGKVTGQSASHMRRSLDIYNNLVHVVNWEGCIANYDWNAYS